MNKAITYFACFFCGWIFISGCKPKVPAMDLKETYLSTDTRPFGGYVAKGILQTCFPDNYVQTIKEAFEKTESVSSDTSSVYFSVSRNLYVDEKDVDGVLNFVYSGNTVFFAAANIDTLFLNKIFCEVSYPNSFMSGIPNYQQTSVSLIEEIAPQKDSFGYFYKPFESYFSKINERYGRIVGYNASGQPNCIVFFWGKGKLFLHSDPRVFSNYFLLKKDNYRYMQQLMQVTNDAPQHVYWNDYYAALNSRKSGSGKSSLSELFKYPALKSAFLLSLLLLGLYIRSERKRRQRIIPEIKPNLNSSVAFTETIARLYLQKHDNKNIADKMITYFHEFIRNNYFLNSNMGNREFITALSRKSGIPEEKTTSLFHAIQHATQSNTLDDYQLLSLNEQIQQFYKTKK